MTVVKLFFASALFIVSIFLGVSIVGKVAQLTWYTNNCDGHILVSGGTASCIPKVEGFSKPSAMVERISIQMFIADLERFLDENDPSLTQQHNGLTDPCPLIKMPTCKED